MSNKSKKELDHSQDSQQATMARRGFMQASSMALLIGALAPNELASSMNPNPVQAEDERPFFTARRYTQQEIDQIYGRGLRAARVLGPGGGSAAGTASAMEAMSGTRNLRDTPSFTLGQHMLFYYDKDAKQFVNPFNVNTSLTAGKYSLEVSILSSHVSQSDFETVWKDLKSDAHMQMSLTAASATGESSDDVMWTLMNGIDIFLGGKFEGLDKRLRPFVDKNQPTSKFRPSEKVEILKGGGFFQLQLAAQKKESWWHKLLTIFGAAVNSPLFATLPIPKLLPEAVGFTTAVLNQVKKTEPLVPIWQSAGIPFILYNGATPASDFKFKPGRWLTIDRAYAVAHSDENGNLKDHVVDIAGQFNEVKTKAGQSIDTNYSVLQLDFPLIQS